MAKTKSNIQSRYTIIITTKSKKKYIRSSVRTRTHIYMCMHLYPHEFAFFPYNVHVLNKHVLQYYFIWTACTYAYAVDRAQYSQMNANARTQINACKLIVAFNAWAISACKRVCVLCVRSKTFKMYYTCRWAGPNRQ